MLAQGLLFFKGPMGHNSTLVQVMPWPKQAMSHYLNQCWSAHVIIYGVTRPKWVNHIQNNLGILCCKYQLDNLFYAEYFEGNITMYLHFISFPPHWCWGGWGCEVSCGGHHQLRVKTTTRDGVSSGWSSVWHRSNTGLSSTQYEQIPIMLGVWPFWLTSFFFGQ